MNKTAKTVQNILWVDVDPVIFNCGARALGKLGYSSMTTYSPIETLKRYARYQDTIGLVVLNITVYDVSWRELNKKLLHINPEFNGIVITGYRDGELLIGSLKQGDIKYLQTPLNFNALSYMIDSLLSNKNSKSKLKTLLTGHHEYNHAISIAA